MDALIMAGGKGSRMASSLFKPLIKFKGRPMINWVVDAVENCVKIEKTYLVLTKRSIGIKEHLDQDWIITKGHGYVKDMIEAINSLMLEETIILSADLPLINNEDIKWVIEEYYKQKNPALSIQAKVETLKEQGLNPSIEINGLVPTGVNILDGRDINGPQTIIITSNPHFYFNINSPADLERLNNNTGFF